MGSGPLAIYTELKFAATKATTGAAARLTSTTTRRCSWSACDSASDAAASKVREVSAESASLTLGAGGLPLLACRQACPTAADQRFALAPTFATRKNVASGNCLCWPNAWGPPSPRRVTPFRDVFRTVGCRVARVGLPDDMPGSCNGAGLFFDFLHAALSRWALPLSDAMRLISGLVSQGWQSRAGKAIRGCSWHAEREGTLWRS